MAAIYILFPKEHPDLLPEAIQHYRWSVERFEIMMEHYSLARSALGVLHAIYLRLRKTLGISFLENDHGLSGICGPGAAPVDALTLSNIDPSLKDEGPILGTGGKKGCGRGAPGQENGTRYQGTNGSVSTSTGLTPGGMSSGSAASSTGSDIFSNSIGSNGTPPTTEPPVSGGVLRAKSTGSNTSRLGQTSSQQQLPSGGGDSEAIASSDLLDPQLMQQHGFDGNGINSLAGQRDEQAAVTDSIFPDNFDWSLLPPICPTGDLAYNILLGVSDGSAAVWGGAGGGGGIGGGGNLMGGIGGSSMDLLNTFGAGASGLSADLDAADTAALAAAQAARAATAAESEAGATALPTTDDGPGANSSIDGTVIPWQFEGDFGNNSLWSLLNNYTSF